MTLLALNQHPVKRKKKTTGSGPGGSLHAGNLLPSLCGSPKVVRVLSKTRKVMQHTSNVEERCCLKFAASDVRNVPQLLRLSTLIHGQYS